MNTVGLKSVIKGNCFLSVWHDRTSELLICSNFLGAKLEKTLQIINKTLNKCTFKQM